MADVYLTLADLVKINSKDVVDLGVTDILNDAPLLKVLAADESSNGTTHKWVVETGATDVGFRAANAGLENKASADTVKSVDLKILDGSFAVDKALATSYHKGWESYVAREAMRHLRAIFYEAEKQIINGTGNDSDGFLGFADELDVLGDTMVYNAAGNSALTSVYLVRTNDNGTDCQVVMANNGEIEIGETVEQRIQDGTGKHYTGLYTTILGWLGVQTGSTYSIGRIANIEEDTNKLTDDMIAEGLAMFPAARLPNYIVMNRRSLKQLQQSRTATNATGSPAPFPSEAFGIPIIVSDAITNSESAVASS